MTIVFVLDNGYEIRLKCEEFFVERDGFGNIKKWKATGVKENVPLYITPDKIRAIYRVYSDENFKGNNDIDNELSVVTATTK